MFGAVKPFIAAIAFVGIASFLLVAIYFTLLDLQWIAFLAGTLFASMLAMVSRATRAELAAVDSGAKFALSQAQLLAEIELRKGLDTRLQLAAQRLHYADEVFPLLTAFTDAGGVLRYHNHAFRRWVDLPERRIDGHHMREVLGSVVYTEIEAHVARALDGEAVRYERTQKMANGTAMRLAVQLLPLPGGGFFSILADITASEAAVASASQSNFDASVAEAATGLPNVRERMLAAIEHDEFALYCQAIAPLAAGALQAGHFEILIRLIEEESNLIPPGAFLPLADEQGLLPQLDRWVVSHLLRHLIRARVAGSPQGQSLYFINIAAATLCDQDFPAYVAQQLQATGVPGDAICFEIVNKDLIDNPQDAEHFMRAMRQAKCRIALSGFGRDRVSVALLKSLPLDFVKIDGSLVLAMPRDPVAHAKVMTIHRVAREQGIATIAEMVEDAATEALLRDMDVDYAQGFGISQPRPLGDAGG